MEILRKSDAMESQVREDTRNKARRLLEAADKECAAILIESQRRVQQESERLDAARDARRAALRQELASSLPLEFLRTKLVFIQEAVAGALKDLFGGLSDGELDHIIGRMLRRASEAFQGVRVAVSCAGMSLDRARRIVQESMPGCVVVETKQLSEEEAGRAGQGVILDAIDGSTRYRGTLNEMAGLLLEEQREELMIALLGKDVQK
jgi:vacuolar-type H+-ATPase subunit E/Vma4